MNIHSAEFIMSNDKLEGLPSDGLPEFAFIGRSNVGKSSLINSITQRKGLAKTSQTPGKTTTLVHFLINKGWYLVDLPGYGYAKRSKTDRAKLEVMMKKYFTERQTLQYVFMLVDSSIRPQQVDLDFANWMGEKGVPFVLVFTKADKSPKDAHGNMAGFTKAMKETWEAVPPAFLTSAEKSLGRDNVLGFIEESIEEYAKDPLTARVRKADNKRDFIQLKKPSK